MNQCVITEDQKSSNLSTHPKTSSPLTLPLSPSPPSGLRLCYWVEEPNCFSFVLQDSILSVGLQPPKPQLAAKSACVEECEGLLMVTPLLTVLGARSHTALPYSFSSLTQTCWQTNTLADTNVHIVYCIHTEKTLRQGRGCSIYALQIIATPVLWTISHHY